MLEIDHNLSNTVKHLFLDYQWSPEEIEGRLQTSSTEKLLLVIKQSIEPFIEDIFEDNSLSHGARGVIRKLRHRGKTRHTKGHVENGENIHFSYNSRKTRRG